MTETQRFAAWLRKSMRRHRMSGRALAERAGIDHSSISRLRQGERAPTLFVLDAVCRALGETYVVNEDRRAISVECLGVSGPPINDRERDYLIARAKGEQHKTIAARWGVTLGTVKDYGCDLRRKLGGSSDIEAARLVFGWKLP